jgi:hypothetical protein
LAGSFMSDCDAGMIPAIYVEFGVRQRNDWERLRAQELVDLMPADEAPEPFACALSITVISDMLGVPER